MRGQETRGRGEQKCSYLLSDNFSNAFPIKDFLYMPTPRDLASNASCICRDKLRIKGGLSTEVREMRLF